MLKKIGASRKIKWIIIKTVRRDLKQKLVVVEKGWSWRFFLLSDRWNTLWTTNLVLIPASPLKSGQVNKIIDKCNKVQLKEIITIIKCGSNLSLFNIIFIFWFLFSFHCCQGFERGRRITCEQCQYLSSLQTWLSGYWQFLTGRNKKRSQAQMKMKTLRIIKENVEKMFSNKE